jgi:hypothetical protein
MTQDSSVGTATNYGIDSKDSVPDKGKLMHDVPTCSEAAGTASPVPVPVPGSVPSTSSRCVFQLIKCTGIVKVLIISIVIMITKIPFNIFINVVHALKKHSPTRPVMQPPPLRNGVAILRRELQRLLHHGEACP